MTTGSKINYNKIFEETTDREQGASVLLHCCCGPCASLCLERLKGFKTEAFYYNPNIMPVEEYFKRAESLKKLCAATGTPLTVGSYDNGVFLSFARGLEGEPEGGLRCARCFELRLRETAMEAKRHGFDFFCTTLTVSPHKDSALINRIGFEIEEETGVRYLASDFKKNQGYKRSIELSVHYKLYRQDYCGCKL